MLSTVETWKMVRCGCGVLGAEIDFERHNLHRACWPDRKEIEVVDVNHAAAYLAAERLNFDASLSDYVDEC